MSRAAERSVISLIRLLASAGGEGCGITDGEAGLAVLTKQDGSRARISTAILLDLERRGIALRRRKRLLLTAAGQAALRRIDAGSDRFAAQHRDIAFRPVEDGGQVAVNLTESPLASLSRLKRKDGECWFAPALIAAGDRLRADFTRGQYMQAMGARLEPVTSRGNAARGGGVAEMTEAALAARMRVEKAMKAVGPELSGLLVDVCCHLKGLELVERERQWPQRSAKLMLLAALNMLARHYEPGGATSRPIRNWGAEGFRPDIEADLRG
ncbi:hypothetical protein E2A64_06955 [Pseudohoeflea suaedae]|uniref:DUF6456 domain-containing protein n=1 Tax=Pseudohoeflea suaedae TaxID=877384 RepID=A0A4V3A7H7_9HYPH|nr:DUF6456 domain-containing protein [Pseudohoeflea suaedae]TDH38825.1 hypothetical protein E2A64_06955 [Pseudohoeflea suaedae]